MKIGFSGNPFVMTAGNSNVPAMLKLACDLGYHGIGLRCAQASEGRPSRGAELSAESSDAEIAGIREQFAQAGVEISHMGTDNPTGRRSTIDLVVYEKYLATHAVVAERLGTPMMGVVVGHAAPGQSWHDYLFLLFECVQRVLRRTPDLRIYFENHVGSASAEDLLSAVDDFGDPRLGVQFSPDHSFVMQENVVDLVDRYAGAIHEVCYADRKLINDDHAYFDGRYYYVRYECCIPGEGDVPHDALIGMLVSRGFSGYFSLKYEKSMFQAPTYNHHLPQIEQVLPEFAAFARSYGIIDA